ncbi:hypothetical protein [Streptomyces kebangsaanensis]|uniref:hypothetical protein n=1 Tax=Streptomyces kebangsaanensis TaxID=864058 RepID=UPI000940651B|nr:hypothetical protein [Streptomyces kebangsaanensis]
MNTEITEQPTSTDPLRPAYLAAAALAARLVDQVQILPDAIEAHRGLGTDTYGVRLHYGTGLTAGRGVLETAGIVEAEVTREDVVVDAVWIECRTTVDGIPLIARALTTTADADQLLPKSDMAEAAQPVPAASASPAAVEVPAVFAIRPLAAMKTSTVGTDE